MTLRSRQARSPSTPAAGEPRLSRSASDILIRKQLAPTNTRVNYIENKETNAELGKANQIAAAEWERDRNAMWDAKQNELKAWEQKLIAQAEYLEVMRKEMHHVGTKMVETKKAMEAMVEKERQREQEEHQKLDARKKEIEEKEKALRRWEERLSIREVSIAEREKKVITSLQPPQQPPQQQQHPQPTVVLVECEQTGEKDREKERGADEFKREDESPKRNDKGLETSPSKNNFSSDDDSWIVDTDDDMIIHTDVRYVLSTPFS